MGKLDYFFLLMLYIIFFETAILGIRMLDQPYMTDLIEANSMGHEPHLIDIYSASWGPTDDGKTVDGPRNATMRAIVRGVNEVSGDYNTYNQRLKIIFEIKCRIFFLQGPQRAWKYLCMGFRRRRGR